MTMYRNLKMAAATVAFAVVALSSGASYALETGNIQYNSVNGACQPNPLTGYPWTMEIPYNIPIILTSSNSSGHTVYFLSLASPFVNESGATQNAYSWVYILDPTAGAYALTSAGISGSAMVSGSFTGSITSNSSMGFSINVKLNCGATLVGGTAFIGS